MRCSISTCPSDQHSERSTSGSVGHWSRSDAPDNWILPLQCPGTIRWNSTCVPYVVADNLHDAGVLAGAACYQLRANQIQLFRHVAWGRLSELGGPRFIRIDTLIRSLDLHRAQDAILQQMPEQTLAWIDAFCAGMNAVACVMPRNREARLLGIDHRPFDRHDILAIGRLTGTDVNWPTLFDLFPISGEDGFSEIWQRMMRAGGLVSDGQPDSSGSVSEDFEGVAGSHDRQDDADALSWVVRTNRSGSNSLAIHGSLTPSGKPLLASDPHLNHQLPNLWLLIGIQCPQLHAVGLMFPGLPVIGLGRNPDMAWGGTNLRAASSDLVELDESDMGSITVRQTEIRVRAWPNVRRTLRNSVHGPVISDHLSAVRRSPGRSAHALALRWAGHLPSDEITAFLRLMQCRRAADIGQCMQTYAVTGLNILAADSQGNIAQTHAAWLPLRQGFPTRHFVQRSAQAHAEWGAVFNNADLPFTLNPSDGFLVSTNQHPRADRHVSWYFNGQERNDRLRLLIESVIGKAGRVGIADLQQWQADCTSPQAAALSAAMLSQLTPHARKSWQLALLQQLSGWDGAYHADSSATIVFEGLLAGLRQGIVDASTGVSAWWVVQEWAVICNSLLEDFAALPAADQRRVAQRAFVHARRMHRRFPVWGEAHRVAPQHVLAGLPVVGRRWFPTLDLPGAGSRETLMKNAHGWLTGRKGSTYGAQARQICDLSEIDSNWFVLLGGQDERVESPHALDQAHLWQSGQYVLMPLSDTAIQSGFERVWRFSPKTGP